jgi:putative cell wall-binding protein
VSDQHRYTRFFALLLTVVAVVTMVTVGVRSAEPADAATVTAPALSGSSFTPGMIISDAAFYNGSAMTQAQIQSFLASKGASCTASNCLRSYKLTTSTIAAGSYGAKAYQGASNETAAAIIYKVQVACGVSAKVLLVTLEKEQGLVTTAKAPTTYMLTNAMGYGCPDSTGCGDSYPGLFKQLYYAARQFQIYRLYPQDFNFAAGRTSNIAYSPSSSCGTQRVTVANAATAALYDYTPYVPNSAALSNLYGVGNSCSAYGNRNFWVDYNQWFGPGPFGSIDQAAVTSGKATVSGWTIDPSAATKSLSVQVSVTNPSGVTTTSTVAANLNRTDVGKAYPGAKTSSTQTLHGYSFSASEPSYGEYTFCVVALANSADAFGNRGLGCKSQLFGPPVVRLSGAPRWNTAAAISKAAFPKSGVPVTYIASGETFADGLSAAPAAAKQGGPVLFVQRNAVPGATMTELKRLKPKHIVVVGGASAVSSGVYNTLRGVQKSITRIGGATRYQTSLMIAQSAFPTGTRAFLATGINYPDALSAGAAAGSVSAPVLLVNGSASTTDSALTARLKAMGAKTVDVVGGTSAVSVGSIKGVSSMGASVTRFAGTDRYDTSTKLASAMYKNAAVSYFASGAAYPDALAGAVLAGRTKGPLLITQQQCVPSAQESLMLKLGVKQVTLFGGTAALSSKVAQLGVC